jgi:hypothetical protein
MEGGKVAACEMKTRWAVMHEQGYVSTQEAGWLLAESTLQKVMTAAVLRFGTHHRPRSFAWSGDGINEWKGYPMNHSP